MCVQITFILRRTLFLTSGWQYFGRHDLLVEMSTRAFELYFLSQLHVHMHLKKLSAQVSMYCDLKTGDFKLLRRNQQQKRTLKVTAV